MNVFFFTTRAHHTWWKQGDLTSPGWLEGEVNENLWYFRKTCIYFNVSFPAPTCPPTFHKTNMLHNNLKKDQMTKFGIKYLISNQEHGGAPCTWILGEKKYYWQKILSKYWQGVIGWFHWHQGEKITHLTWYGEPKQQMVVCPLFFYWYIQIFTELNKFVEEYRVIIMLKFYLMKYLSS
jgi:hypothetical protein